jgi:type VI secretion system protein ImpA
MSDNAAAESQVSAWLQPLADDAAPCGPDLEYDNDFLALTQAIAGKPESQFGPAEPPDWRGAIEIAEGLFDRTRDLRVAIQWLRGQVVLNGMGALAPGLRLVHGLCQQHWDHVHPLPDPDDGDPYARVNALTLLREPEGLIGELRLARVIDDRAIGDLNGRQVEVALGLSPLRTEESDLGEGPIAQMLSAAVERAPELRDQYRELPSLVKALVTLLNDKLGQGDAPDLKPLQALVDGLAALLPVDAAADAAADDAAGEAAGTAGGGPRRSLSGAVTSRDEAIRAIDMVCEYLERAEPTNPAPLYLRRGRQLISHNFLQLMKVLAPDALSEVARVVGVDPDSIDTPGAP